MKDKARQRARCTDAQNDATGELDVCIDLLVEMAARGCSCNTPPFERPRHSVSECCQGERCFCGLDASHKVAEVIQDDDPNPVRHELTRYICCVHFQQVMGPAAGCRPFENNEDATYWGHGFKHGWTNGLKKAVRLLKARWRSYKKR